MAKVTAKLIGGSLQEKTAGTVGELAAMLGAEKYQATVNGDPADHDDDLSDYDYVTFAEKVKGA